MKVVKFLIDIRANDDDQYPVIAESMLPYSENAVKYAKNVSVDGKITIEDMEDVL